MATIAELNKLFAVENHAKIVSGKGRLPTVKVKNQAAEATISFLGAQLISFIPNGFTETIWLSKASKFVDGNPIRGGIPICWPWFGKNQDDPNLPMHGFARHTLWDLENISPIDDKTTMVIFVLKPNKESRKLWNYDFTLRAIFTISDTLEVELVTTNKDSKPFTISQGIHTYFKVDNIANISIDGFQKLKYFDKVGGANDIKKQKDEPIVVNQEIDAVFLNAKGPFTVSDPIAKRTITITNKGSNSAVVWNPWKERSKKLSEYTPHSYKTMICVETCNALDDARGVKPGQSHSIKASYSFDKLN